MSYHCSLQWPKQPGGHYRDQQGSGLLLVIGCDGWASA